MLALLSGMLFTSNLPAAQTYWLSDMAPTKEEAKKMRSSHGGMVIRDGQGGYTKRLWLREGSDVLHSSYVTQNHTPLVLITPEATKTEMAFRNEKYADVTFKMPSEGFYNLFMIEEKVEDGVLHKTVIKNESLKHSCRSGHDDVEDKIPPFYFSEAPIDIVRERFPKETFHTRITSGDTIGYRVLIHGQPADGAAVTMITQKGWAKTLQTDQDGMVFFEMIRDYYPPWHEFKRRKMETFLIVAEYDAAESGTHQGEHYDSIHYKATTSGNYFPSTRDYKSYLYGLLVGLFGLTASIFFIYFHRKRRTSIYKEKRLD